MVPPYFTDTGMRSRLCPPPAVSLIKSCNVLCNVAAYSSSTLKESFRCEAQGCIHKTTASCASHHPAAFCFRSHLLLVPVNACLICSNLSLLRPLCQPSSLRRSITPAARLTSSLSVCQISNSLNPGIPIGTPSFRNSMRLSVTFFPDMWNDLTPVQSASLSMIFGVIPAPARISTRPRDFSASSARRERPSQAELL